MLGHSRSTNERVIRSNTFPCPTEVFQKAPRFAQIVEHLLRQVAMGPGYDRRQPGAGKRRQNSITSELTRAIADSSSACATTASIHAPICFISASPMPREVTAGVPSRTPLGLNGLRGSYGTVFELQMIPARSSACA